MSPLTKLFVIVVVIAVVFLVVVVFGFTGSSDTSAKRPWYTGVVDAVTPEPPALSGSDLMASDCFFGQDQTFRTLGNCTVRIRSSDERIRSMKLSLVQGTKVEVSFAGEGENSVKTSFPLRAGSSTSSTTLQVMSGGGTLTLKCVLPPPVPPGLCVVRLGRR